MHIWPVPVRDIDVVVVVIIIVDTPAVPRCLRGRYFLDRFFLDRFLVL